MVAAADGRGPVGGSEGATSGWTERGGYTRVMLAVPGGQEFVTRAGKAAVLFEGNWQTLAQAGARSGGGQPGPRGPIGFNSSLVTDFKLPGAVRRSTWEKQRRSRRRRHRHGGPEPGGRQRASLGRRGSRIWPAAGRRRGSQSLQCPDQGPQRVRHVPDRQRRARSISRSSSAAHDESSTER